MKRSSEKKVISSGGKSGRKTFMEFRNEWGGESIFQGATIGCLGGEGTTVTMNGDEMIVQQQKSKKKKNKKKEEEDTHLEFVEGPSPSDIKDDAPTDNEAESCVVCLTNKRNCIVLPCKHLILCVTCAVILCSGPNKDELKKVGEVACPSCRGNCTSIGKVFQ